ncbi:uncharacterized protein LOC129577329 [Sitodiplosis mosellana]|uniref:uncharacterized protein LOC129577329 n=1 Tax=Sitodiplosis mosellana TaxID=263140 RepID=UPI002445273E|nr:uncharacterized protein LOC129577329 [Sitodiplosis mosellana]
MLRIYRSIAGQRILTGFSSRKCSTAPYNIDETEPETNFVKLIGSAWSDTVDLLNGDKSCKVVQRCQHESGQQFSISHMVTFPKRLLETTGITGLERGQKFNINGYVRSIPFKTSHGKMRRAISIMPHSIELYNDEAESVQDMCIVMLTAHIESPIWHQENLTMFSLRTHVPVRDADIGFTGQMVQHSHTVIVYDRNVQNYIRRHLARYDGLFIEGYLNYQKCETDDGSTRMSGNIVAVHIEKT